MTDQQNPAEQFAKLLRAVDKAIEDMDLSRAIPGVSLVLDQSEHPDTIGITFRFDGDILASPEQRKMDSIFEQIVSSMESQDKVNQKLNSLLEDWKEDE
jgi:hypothetical protein